ncbi:prepilin-type N-terminal cleavage/methylation domain-containing protein [Cerasicoccus maritimus]|uniref:prepilin-type N-terminal cleavage/methylation domain-containing protein n=1 Tax=Cerasicoccus maritimus TaxID=490089 RepID=UPI0028527233|nr:prepilin-type N-terminal cleavage/methylation domain-containing protein [Cerasicoccus maritimus]
MMMKEKTLKSNKRGGFTLLELLVVVAILAAVAGTATIALKDTDARASAAAHVAMMDELNKGIRSYRILKKNELPSNLDSLVQTGTAGDATAGVGLEIAGFSIESDGSGDAYLMAIPTDVQEVMSAGGITALQYVDTTVTPADSPVSCSDLAAVVNSRGNAVVAGNIFMSPDANGCGFSQDMDGAAAYMGVWWQGGSERLTGQPESGTEFDGSNLATADSTAYLLTGIGPSSTLFDANELGGMTTVPVYRHVGPDEYGRFIAVWNVGAYDGSGSITAGDQVELVTIVDGALDTKEEELGEWDGTRNTI